MKLTQNLSIGGEFKITRRSRTGEVKQETEWQKNLITDNYIKFFFGEPQTDNTGRSTTYNGSGYGIEDIIVVGTGNTAPNAANTQLTSYLKTSTNRHATQENFVPPSGDHPNHIQFFRQSRHVIQDMPAANVTELGLAWFEYGRGRNSHYYLLTHALIKDSGGQPTTVTTEAGDILEIDYRVSIYVSTERKQGTFTLTTSEGGQDTTAEFDYVSLVGGIGASTPTKPINIGSGLVSYPVPAGQSDDQVNGSFDLNANGYETLTYSSYSSHHNHRILSESPLTSSISTDKASVTYMAQTITHKSSADMRIAWKNTCGVYTHNHPRGIRIIGVGINGAVEAVTLFIVKNKANGQGIKKTNRQLLDLEFEVTFDRWNG